MKKNKRSIIINGQSQHLRDKWKNLYDSKEKKISEGAVQANTNHTVPHGEQWRGQNKKHRKAK